MPEQVELTEEEKQALAAVTLPIYAISVEEVLMEDGVSITVLHLVLEREDGELLTIRPYIETENAKQLATAILENKEN